MHTYSNYTFMHVCAYMYMYLYVYTYNVIKKTMEYQPPLIANI